MRIGSQLRNLMFTIHVHVPSPYCPDLGPFRIPIANFCPNGDSNAGPNWETSHYPYTCPILFWIGTWLQLAIATYSSNENTNGPQSGTLKLKMKLSAILSCLDPFVFRLEPTIFFLVSLEYMYTYMYMYVPLILSQTLSRASVCLHVHCTCVKKERYNICFRKPPFISSL